MYQMLAKKGQMFAIILGVVVIAIYVITVTSGLGSAGYSMSDDLNQVMKSNPDQTFSFFDIGLGLTIGLVVIAAVIALLFGIWQVISSPKDSLKGIISMVAIAAIFFIMYNMADSDLSSPIAETLQKFDVGENVSKLISGGMLSTLILTVVAVGSMVLLEIYNFFK